MHRRTQILAVASLAAAVVASPAAGAPSDSLQGEQWAFSPDTVFDLPHAWELSQGAGVTVAVVDSGMKLDHPDLAPNVWTNFGEIPGNGIDDDGNGYVDDVHGVDLTNDGKANEDLHDGFGHGTHVSGTIAAAANGRGVVGVAFKAKLMTVKVLDDNGAGMTGAVAEGIRYAAANGARIINLSIESSVDDPRVRAAIEAAAAANVLVICSAGNSGYNVDQTPVYPVSIAAPNLVGVAATEPDDGRALPDFSNYGKLTIPVAAPGVDVLSTSRTGGYELKSGTSMAAPHVTGVAALMASLAPNLPAADLRALLLQNAARGSVPVGAGLRRRLRRGARRQPGLELRAQPAAAGQGALRHPPGQGPQGRHQRPDRADRRQPERQQARAQARRQAGGEHARGQERADGPPARAQPAASSRSPRSPPTAARWPPPPRA